LSKERALASVCENFSFRFDRFPNACGLGPKYLCTATQLICWAGCGGAVILGRGGLLCLSYSSTYKVSRTFCTIPDFLRS
jgi:hypothetical protein